MDMSREVELCDTGLALGLSIGGRSAASSTGYRRLQEACLPLGSSMAVQKQPSVTLSLSDDVYGGAGSLKAEANKACEEGLQLRPSSPHSHSTVSSFCTAYTPRIKREKDVAGSEEVEVKRAASHGGSYDESDGSARKKLRLTKEQSALLEDRFKEHNSLNPKQKHALAKQLNLRPRQVEIWFQNRRARSKLKQTEVDCEFLKRCCKSLTDENRRLRKELHELKALEFAPPVYMQLPAATLTMCPSCKTIGAAADSSKGGAAAESFVVAPKPHRFNPFIHSATC